MGITLHHFGYDDSVIAIGAFLEYKGILPSEDIDTTIPLDIKPLVISSKGILPSEDIDTTIPLDIKPLVISIKDDIAPKEKNIGLHLEDILTATIAQIASEI